MILLVDNYDSFTYNLYQLLRELGARVSVRRNDAIGPREVERMRPKGLVLSPGPGRPEESGRLMEILEASLGKIPLLGVCLGHQALGLACGARVVRAPRPMHGKLSPVRHKGRGVFRGLPSPFEAARYHSLVVERSSLPKALEATAWTEDGLVMGVRHRRLRAEGVQFHPESVATEQGRRLLKNFLEATR